MRNAELADALERLGRDGAEPFYRGDIAAAVADWVTARGGTLGRADLAAYEAIVRAPVSVAYRGRDVLTDPPPSAGGTLLAYSLSLLDRGPSPPSPTELVEAMACAQDERTPEFMAGLIEDGFLDRFLATRLGSTTHISVLDKERPGLQRDDDPRPGLGDGRARDGDPRQQHHGRGRSQPARLPPPPARPADAEHDGADRRPRRRPVELVLGSAGSNRIRSAILQTIIGVLDHGCRPTPPSGPRGCTSRTGASTSSRASTRRARAGRLRVNQFGGPNLFFGGVQAVERPARRSSAPATRAGAAWRSAHDRWAGSGRGGATRAGAAGGRRMTGGRARAAAAAAAVAAVLAGCGDTSADLFAVTRSGTSPGATFAMIVRDDGTVTCDGVRRPLPDDLLITARGIADDLQAPATAGVALPSGPRPVFTLLRPGSRRAGQLLRRVAPSAGRLLPPDAPDHPGGAPGMPSPR